MSYTGRIVAVTGAASGIGRAIAEQALARGAIVVALDRDDQALAMMREALADGRLHTARVDVADGGSIDEAMHFVQADLGSIDLLVNSAGIVSRSTFESMPLDDWQRVTDINLTGAFLCMQKALPLLRRGTGRAVVNVASIAAKRVSYTGGASYTAAKAGLLGLTRHAAFELAGEGIRINAVCPGPVWTALTAAAISEAEKRKVASMVPLGRWLNPDDVAEAVLFLGSDGARMVTGTTLDIDGGLSLVTAASPASYVSSRE